MAIHFFVNFDIFYILLTFGSIYTTFIYTKLGDFVNLGLYFMTVAWFQTAKD